MAECPALGKHGPALFRNKSPLIKQLTRTVVRIIRGGAGSANFQTEGENQ